MKILATERSIECMYSLLRDASTRRPEVSKKLRRFFSEVRACASDHDARFVVCVSIYATAALHMRGRSRFVRRSSIRQRRSSGSVKKDTCMYYYCDILHTCHRRENCLSQNVPTCFGLYDQESPKPKPKKMGAKMLMICMRLKASIEKHDICLTPKESTPCQHRTSVHGRLTML